MSEQFIKAFAVDPKKLDHVVGCKDEKVLQRALAADAAEDVAELVGERDLELEAVLREIMFGKLVTKRAYVYRRTLELVAATVGKALGDEATMPGRGWQDIGPLWRHWGMPTLASVWGGGGSENPECTWPLRKMNVDWPIAYWIPKKKLPRLKKELVAFRTKKAIAKGIPEGIPRFSEGEWPIDDLANELDAVVRVLRGWCKASDVLVWHDGQQ
jgi:hypothetical protein